MKKILLMSFAALFGSCGFASAGTYIVEQSQSRYLQCYNQVYVPAKVLINTRGKLVRGYSKNFEIVGTSWNYVRNPAVYIQTQRIVESDHYTLVGTACPPG